MYICDVFFFVSDHHSRPMSPVPQFLNTNDKKEKDINNLLPSSTTVPINQIIETVDCTVVINEHSKDDIIKSPTIKKTDENNLVLNYEKNDIDNFVKKQNENDCIVEKCDNFKNLSNNNIHNINNSISDIDKNKSDCVMVNNSSNSCDKQSDDDCNMSTNDDINKSSHDNDFNNEINKKNDYCNIVNNSLDKSEDINLINNTSNDDITVTIIKLLSIFRSMKKVKMF